MHILRVSSSLHKSKWIRMITSILHFRKLRLRTSQYDALICSVVQKSFLHEWNKHVKWPFDYRYTPGIYMNNFHKLTSSFYSDILKQSEVNFFICLHLQKHIYEYLLYNNMTNTTLAQDVFPCNTICYITNGNIGIVHLKFQAYYASLNESKCNTSILYIRRSWLKTSKYDSSIYNVVQKSFLYKWKKQVKWPFENAITDDSILIIFIN
jgi:hypothetical protein